MFGCPKEPLYLGDSFKYYQHMFKLRNKKNNFQLRFIIWSKESGQAGLAQRPISSFFGGANGWFVTRWLNFIEGTLAKSIKIHHVETCDIFFLYFKLFIACNLTSF